MGSQYNSQCDSHVILYRPGARRDGVEASNGTGARLVLHQLSKTDYAHRRERPFSHSYRSDSLGNEQDTDCPSTSGSKTTFPYTHRAAVILHTDDSIAVESEDIQNIAFPRQRFAKPVKYAIPAYGNAPQDEEESRQPETEVPQSETRGAEISFPVRSTQRNQKSSRKATRQPGTPNSDGSRSHVGAARVNNGRSTISS